jgi:hypothetical protein
MNKKMSLMWVMAAAMLFGLVGCDSDSEGGAGTGGTGGMAGMGGDGGTGGSGGIDAGMAMVRVAHLGTNLPTAEDTAVDVTVDGTVAIPGLTFAQSTEFVSLPAGEHTFGVNVAGTDTEVFSVTTTLPENSISTIVAIASVNVMTDAEDPLNVLLFNGDLTGLPTDSGRVLVGHGFDAVAFETVDVILPATCAMDGALVEDLGFATVRPVGDLPEADYVIALAAPGSCDTAVGPLTAPVTPNVATLLIAAADSDGAPQVYAIIGDFFGNIPTLQASP